MVAECDNVGRGSRGCQKWNRSGNRNDESMIVRRLADGLAGAFDFSRAQSAGLRAGATARIGGLATRFLRPGVSVEPCLL